MIWALHVADVVGVSSMFVGCVRLVVGWCLSLVISRVICLLALDTDWSDLSEDYSIFTKPQSISAEKPKPQRSCANLAVQIQYSISSIIIKGGVGGGRDGEVRDGTTYSHPDHSCIISIHWLLYYIKLHWIEWLNVLLVISEQVYQVHCAREWPGFT